MVIAIHSILPYEEETDKNFFHEIFTRIISSHPDDKFIFITNDKAQQYFSGENFSFVHPGEVPKNRLYATIWYANKLKRIVKEKKPDILIHTNLYFSKTEIPQILFLPNVSFDKQPKDNNSLLRLSNKKTEQFFAKAKNSILRSTKEKAHLSKKYPSTELKTEVILPGMNIHQLDLNIDEREAIKEKIAEGNEYFIYSGVISPQKNLVNLLKAFSAFKKRQKSGMQLIITGKEGKDFEQFSDLLKTYKLREQVKLLPTLNGEEEEQMFAAAYALIIPSSSDRTVESIFFAMQNSVPVLAAVNSMAEEICVEAGIYFDSANSKDIAEKMMLIFKDEDKRNELIELGKGRIPLFDWDESAEKVADIIFD